MINKFNKVLLNPIILTFIFDNYLAAAPRGLSHKALEPGASAFRSSRGWIM